MENLHAKEPYRDWLRSYVVSSPLNDISSCAKIGGRDLAGKRYFRQAAKDPFLKRWRQERSGRVPGKRRVYNAYKGRILQGRQFSFAKQISYILHITARY